MHFCFVLIFKYSFLATGSSAPTKGTAITIGEVFEETNAFKILGELYYSYLEISARTKY